MTWGKTLRELFSDGKTGRLSSTRVTAFLAGLSLCFSLVWLSVASFWNPELVDGVVALGPTLGLMAGANYMMMRHTGSKDQKNEP